MTSCGWHLCTNEAIAICECCLAPFCAKHGRINDEGLACCEECARDFFARPRFGRHEEYHPEDEIEVQWGSFND